jgi:YHS domain-containing protein
MTCAVCDKSLTKDNAAAKTTHDKREYYFCGEACEKKFEANRVQYMKPFAKMV